MEGSAHHQAQTTNAGSKISEEADQHPEAPIPLDKATGEDTERVLLGLDEQIHDRLF